MKPNEKRLVIILATVLGFAVFGLLSWFWFVIPVRDYNARIKAMEEENEAKQIEINRFVGDRKRLVLAKLKSLPANRNEASSEYINYLHPLFINSGLKPEEITPSEPVEMKVVTNIPNVKKVGHKVMTFTVRARGTLAQLVSAMEGMRNTPYEHRIKTLTIDRADNAAKDPNAKLIINMTIETLLVAKTESKPGVPPGVDVRMVFADSLSAHLGGPAGLGQALATVVVKQSVLPEGERQYADIGKRNFFVGAIPIEPKRPPKTVKPPVEVEPIVKLPPSPGPIPDFIRLVQIESLNEEAYFLNLFYEKDEQKISAKADSGYNTHMIESKDRTYQFFLFKVIKVDSRAVFIQIKDKVHQWHLGDTLAYATSKKLSSFEMEALDVVPDFDWGKKELEKEKKQTTKKTNTKTKGGR